ncbi:MAG: HAD-IA family hydrolase [Candidatus Hydrothermarchaeota archaeon]
MDVICVLFDMDGVLTDSFGSCHRAFEDALVHFGHLQIGPEEYRRRCWGTPVEEDFEAYLGKAMAPEATEYYHAHYQEFIGYSTVAPGAEEVLQALRGRGLGLAVVTNTHRSLATLILRHFRLYDYFDAVLGGDDVRRGKPDPEIVMKACEALGSPAARAVLVGDTENDMKAGKAAGCTTVGLGVEGDFRIEALGELLEVLG